MALYLTQVVHFLFVGYTTLLFLRILSSWVPMWQGHHLVRFVAFCTDPYLSVFRRLLPPLGGAFDLSPILAFFVLRIGESILLAGLQWFF